MATVPQYDLEAKRAAVNLDALPKATWGTPKPLIEPSQTAPPTGLPERGAQLDPAGFRYRRALPAGSGGLVSLQLDAAVLAHSTGPQGSFGDVRVIDEAGHQIPYLLEQRDEPLSLDLQIDKGTTDIPSLRDSANDNRSIYAIDLPYGNLPGPRLVLETSDRVFRRSLEIGVERAPDRRHRDKWLDVLAASVWQHADQATPAPPLDVTVSPGDGTRLLLIVEEGDNRALPITAARLLLPSWRLRFFRPAGPLQLVYGRANTVPPQYDLALLAPAVLGTEAREITAAAEVPSDSAPAMLLSRRQFWIGLSAAAVILLALLVRLISSGTTPPR